MPSKKINENKMQPKESPIPENRQKENEDENRMTMTGPSMRPRPRPTKALTPEQQKYLDIAEKRSHELTQQLVTTQKKRQNWINEPRKMRRVQKILAKDEKLRNALFDAFLFDALKGGAVAFPTLNPADQLRVVRKVDSHLKNMARRATKQIGLALAPDPNDVMNPYNQANPNNLANTQQAAWQANIERQDIEVAQLVQKMDDEAAEEQHEEELTAENNAEAFTLTAAELEDINSHNKEFNPSPKPGAQPDDEELKEGKKTFVEDSIAREALEHKGEEKALMSFMENDKKGYIEGAKGAAFVSKEAIEHTVTSVAMSAGKALVMGA